MPQVSPGRERIYSRQMFSVELKNWCPNVQNRIPSLLAGKLCHDFHLVTQNKNHSQTSTATVENSGAENAGKGRLDGGHHDLLPGRHYAETHFWPLFEPDVLNWLHRPQCFYRQEISIWKRPLFHSKTIWKNKGYLKKMVIQMTFESWASKMGVGSLFLVLSPAKAPFSP